jgi:hypothetical protein
VYRVLWDESYSDYAGNTPLALSRQILRRLEDGATVDDLITYLDERNKDGIHHAVAYLAHREYHRAVPEPGPGRSRLRRVLWGVPPAD